MTDESEIPLPVSDSGPGIPEEDLPHAFDRFYHSDTSRTGSERTGPGLAITRAIVEAHGGKIRVESPPDPGAILAIEIPLRQDA